MDISSVSSAAAQVQPNQAASKTITNPAQSEVATQAISSVPGASILGPQVQLSGSALLGGSSGGTSVLAAFDSDDASSLFGDLTSQSSTLINQVKLTLDARLQDQLDQIDNAAADATTTVNAQNESWISVKSEINNAQIAVSNAQDSVGRVSSTLLEMRTSIANAGTKGEDVAYWKQQFDTQINGINLEAESADPTDNLVGNINPTDGSPNTVSYRSDTDGLTSTLQGTYIGSTFTIQTANGEQWKLDNQTDLLQAYNEGGSNAETYTTRDGQTLPKATSTHTGLKLVSYNPDTQNITVDVTVVPTDPPLRITGKMQISGVGLMGSWFYNGFTTVADRNRAFSDIDKAETSIVSSQATLQLGATQTASDQKHANDALDQLSAQTVKIQQDQQAKTQVVQAEAAQQFLGIQANLRNLTSMQSNYMQAFSGFIDDPLAQVALDQNA